MIGQLYDTIIVRLRVLILQIIIERKVTLTHGNIKRGGGWGGG